MTECPPPTQTRRLRRKHRALVLAEAGPPPRGRVSAQRDRTPPTPRPSPQFPQLQGEEWPDPRLPWRSSACSDCCKHVRPVSGRNEGRGTEFLPGPNSRPGPASASCRWGHPAWSSPRTDAKAPTSFWTRQRGAVRVAAPRRVRPARTPLPQARVSRRAGPTDTPRPCTGLPVPSCPHTHTPRPRRPRAGCTGNRPEQQTSYFPFSL